MEKIGLFSRSRAIDLTTSQHPKLFQERDMDKSLINELICKCWLDTTHLPIHSVEVEELTNKNDLYIASVIFSGKIQGSMTIATGQVLAKKIASVMFDCEMDSVSFDDIRDSIGELVNILAGNIKSDFFGDCELSSPLVMQGGDAILSVLGSDVVFQKIFLSDEDEQCVIQICQTN